MGCKDKTFSWHLNGFPDCSNIGSTVSCRIVVLKNSLNASKPSEHPPDRGKNVKTFNKSRRDHKIDGTKSNRERGRRKKQTEIKRRRK